MVEQKVKTEKKSQGAAQMPKYIFVTGACCQAWGRGLRQRQLGRF